MPITAKDGAGTTVTFGTSGFAAKIVSVGGPSMERDSIDCTNMASTPAQEFLEAALYDGGTLDLTVEHLGTLAPPIAGATEAITIDWAGSADTWGFNGFMTAYSPGAEIGDRMTAELSVKAAGAVSF